YYLMVPLKRSPESNLLMLQVIYNDVAYYFDILLENDFLAPGVVLMEKSRNIPVFDSYLLHGSSYRFIDSFATLDATAFYCYQYNHSFSAALPPMATRAEGVDKELTIDSMFAVSSNNLWEVPGEALYFIQEDTASLRGIAF